MNQTSLPNFYENHEESQKLQLEQASDGLLQYLTQRSNAKHQRQKNKKKFLHHLPHFKHAQSTYFGNFSYKYTKSLQEFALESLQGFFVVKDDTVLGIRSNGAEFHYLPP